MADSLVLYFRTNAPDLHPALADSAERGDAFRSWTGGGIALGVVLAALVIVPPLASAPVPDNKQERLLDGYFHSVTDFEISPDGRTLAVAGDRSKGKDGDRRAEVVLVSIPTGRIQWTKWYWASCLDFSPDGKYLAAGSAGQIASVTVWETATHKCVHNTKAHIDMIRSVSFSPDGQSLLSTADNCVKIWDARRGNLRCTFSFATKRDEHVAAVRNDYKMELCEAALLCADVKIDKQIDYLGPGYWLPDSRTIMVVTGTSTVPFLNVTTGKCVRLLRTDHRRGIWQIALSPDGKLLVTCGMNGDGRVCLWDSKTFKRIAVLDTKHEEACAPRFTPDGKVLVVACKNGPLQVWDVSKRALMRTIGDDLASEDVAFFQYRLSPDGTLIVAQVGFTPRLHFWRLATGKEARFLGR